MKYILASTLLGLTFSVPAYQKSEPLYIKSIRNLNDAKPMIQFDKAGLCGTDVYSVDIAETETTSVVTQHQKLIFTQLLTAAAARKPVILEIWQECPAEPWGMSMTSLGVTVEFN